MKRIWLYLLPAMYLPTLGGPIETPWGNLRVADILILPFLISVLIAARPKNRVFSGQLVPILLLFVIHVVLGILTVPERFPYQYVSPVGSLLVSFGAMAVFAWAGMTIPRCIDRGIPRRDLITSLIFTGIILGVSFVSAAGDIPTLRQWYGNTNGYSVVMAMFLCFFFAMWVEERGTDTLPRILPFILVLLVGGIMLSNGRGGWLAAFAGFAYVLYRRGPRRRLMIPVWIGLGALPILYQSVPNFKREVDRTFFPDRAAEFGYAGTRNVGNIDDGARFELWTQEIVKWIDAPFLGTGYFHRGGETTIISDGSHNYFIQILLETGLIGILLLALLLSVIWKQAGSRESRRLRLELPIKTMLVVSVVGGLGGEYFYGGSMVLAFFLLYSMIGSLPRRESRSPVSMRSREMPYFRSPSNDPFLARERTA